MAGHDRSGERMVDVSVVADRSPCLLLYDGAESGGASHRDVHAPPSPYRPQRFPQRVGVGAEASWFSGVSVTLDDQTTEACRVPGHVGITQPVLQEMQGDDRLG